MITASSSRAGKKKKEKKVLGHEEEEEILFKFLADMRTKLSWRSPTRATDLWVFWSQEEEEAINSLLTSTSSVLAIRNQIITALFSFKCFVLDDVLVQFWAPTTTGGPYLLTTAHQPFAIGQMTEQLARYRTHCVRYECGVGESIPGRAFRNQVNECSPDVSHYSINDYPLRDLALSCGITQILALPIFQHHSFVCVGVLELLLVSTRIPSSFSYLSSVFHCLEREGLTIINPYKIRREQLPKQIQEKEGVDPKHVTEEIRNTLQHASKIFHLPLACAWVRCVHSTSMGHGGNLSGTGDLVVLMPDTITIVDTHMSWGDFHEAANYLQAMRVGSCLLGNAFLSHKPYLCRDVTQLSMSEYPIAHAARTAGFTGCFAISLQSIATGNHDFVLEFFLPKGTPYSRSDFHGFLSSVMAILKQHLKSFEAVTGDPADELFIEYDKSSFSTVFESSKTCPSPTIVTHIESGALQNEGEVLQADFSCPQLVMKELVEKGSDSFGLEQSQVAPSKEKHLVKKSNAQDQMKESSCSYRTLEQHFGKKLEDAAKSLGVSRSTVKRWCRDNNIRRWPFPKRGKVSSSQPIPKQINAPILENAVPISESSVRDPSSSDLLTNLEPNQATSTMMVKATYRNDIIKFQLCFSSTMTELVENVILRLKLSKGTFKIKYQDEDSDYILISCDKDLQDCMNSVKETTIKMLIEPITCIAP